MATRSHSTVVGVFADHAQAQRAVAELRRMGFTEDLIGVARRDADDDRGALAGPTDAGDETYAGEGTAAGLATGAGVGALWGLGIIAGVLPAIGPAIAGGTLAAILSSAAAGAVAAGLGGALIGLGLSKEEADFYNTEFESGRTVVTVTAAGRMTEAESVIRQHGGYDLARQGIAGESMTDAAMTDRALASESLAGESMTGTRMGDRAGAMASDRAPAMMRGETSLPDSMRPDDTNRVTAFEEELQVEKRAVETGDVNVRKEVHTEHKTIDVPVQREEVVIERRAPSPSAGGSMEGHQEIHIPVREEQISIEKVPVAKEEVVVGKRKVTDTKHVQETLRKEEIKIDADPDVPVRDRRNET